MTFKIKKSLSAFTIIEMVVVLAIIGIITVIMLRDWSGGRTTQQLDSAGREVEAVVREAQNYALTGSQGVPGTEPCQFQITWGGAGYTTIYWYKNAAGACNQQLAGFRSYTLKNGVTFSAGGSFSFSLPHAGVVGGSQTILLTKSGASQVVCVSASGLISTQSGANCP